MAEPEEKKEAVEDPEKEKNTVDKTMEDKATEKTEGLSELAKDFISELPEDMQALIPASLSDVEKVKLARGLLVKVATMQSTDQDSPGSRTPGKKTKPDYNAMSSSELLESGLK